MLSLISEDNLSELLGDLRMSLVKTVRNGLDAFRTGL